LFSVSFAFLPQPSLDRDSSTFTSHLPCSSDYRCEPPCPALPAYHFERVEEGYWKQWGASGNAAVHRVSCKGGEGVNKAKEEQMNVPGRVNITGSGL
jgi:hypothetical protein